MQKKVILALIVILGVASYLLLRTKKSDTPVSTGDTDISTPIQQSPEISGSHSPLVDSPNSQLNDQAEATRPTAPDAAPVESSHQSQESQSVDAANTAGEPTYTSLGDQQKEERLSELLNTKGSDVEKYVEVQSIVCDQGSCTVDAVAKSDPARFQMSMASLLEQNPWLGSEIKMQTPPGKPGIATFKFVKE